MRLREASLSDIPGMSIVRLAVRENCLSNPALITTADYQEYMTGRGKGWVCEIEGAIAGFAVVDVKNRNIWALFVHPDHAEKGIGKRLHNLMMDWYFQQTKKPVWLGTAPDTRAEVFYEKMGWRKTGLVNKGEVKFEMSWADWAQRNS